MLILKYHIICLFVGGGGGGTKNETKKVRKKVAFNIRANF